MVSATGLDGLRLRAFDPATDYPALVELIHASNRFDGVDDLPTVENLRAEQAHIEGFDPARGRAPGRDRRLRSAPRPGRSPGPATAGAATTSRRWVAPGFRRRGIGTLLAGLGRASVPPRSRPSMAEPGRASSRRGSTQTQAGAVALLEARGYEIGRYGFLMTRDISGPIEPLALPDGLEIRPVRGGPSPPDLGRRRRGVSRPLEQRRADRGRLRGLVRRARDRHEPVADRLGGRRGRGRRDALDLAGRERGARDPPRLARPRQRPPPLAPPRPGLGPDRRRPRRPALGRHDRGGAGHGRRERDRRRACLRAARLPSGRRRRSSTARRFEAPA